MTIPIRIQCSKSYPPQEDVMQSRWKIAAKRIWRTVCEAREAINRAGNGRWKWWELALVAAIVLAGIWALFATAEAQIVRGLV